MKRSWIGFLLLLILLTGGILSAWAMVRLHGPLEEELNRAAESALLGDWDRAEACFRRAGEQWKKLEHFRACFADHTPVEDIDADFAMLEVYCRTREPEAFAAACRSLARKTAAVGEAHELVWWNLL